MPTFMLIVFGIADELYDFIDDDLGLTDNYLIFLITIFCILQPTILLLVYRKRLAKIWKHLDLGRLD